MIAISNRDSYIEKSKSYETHEMKWVALWLLCCYNGQ